MFIIIGCLENLSMDWKTGWVWDAPRDMGFWKYLGYLQHY